MTPYPPLAHAPTTQGGKGEEGAGGPGLEYAEDPYGDPRGLAGVYVLCTDGLTPVG